MEKTELEAMTVLELRKVAKEKKVVLGAGIDKAGIVAKILAAEEPGKGKSEKENDVFQASFDVTAAPVKPYSRPSFGPQDRENRSGNYAGWQNHTQQLPSNRPVRPVSGQTRFGPQAKASQEPSSASPEPEEAKKETVVTADGYRLGYQAKPQKPSYPSYRQDYGRTQPPHSAGGQQPGTRPYVQRSLPQQEAENHFHDDVYRMAHNAEFDKAIGNELPGALRLPVEKEVSGLLELNPEGYGFLRSDLYTVGQNEAYVSAAQIRRFGLRPGDRISGMASRVREADKYPALMYVKEVNGNPAEENPARPEFEKNTPVFPSRRIVLDEEAGTALRLVDLVAPIGFGQRMLIKAQPESGSLVLLRDIANGILRSSPDAEVLLLLVDATPEEINEVKETTKAHVFAADFSSQPEIQARACETILERAMRIAEQGKDAVILLDSLTKMVKAYQNSLSQGTRAITGAVTPAALVRPKRFFGMARNLREGGSLTIISTVLVETGSRADDIIYEEFKSAANAEVVLTTFAPGNPLFPMLDLQQSWTRRGDMLLSIPEKDCIQNMKVLLSSIPNKDAVSQLADMVQKTGDNAELLSRLQEWIALMKKNN